MNRKFLNGKSQLAVFAAILLTCSLSGCGTRKLLGIQGTGGVQSHSIFGIGGTVQLAVTAKYTGGISAVDVTSIATYVSSIPSVVTVSRSGLLTVITGYCDFVPVTPPATGFAIDLAKQVQVTATFQGQTTVFFVDVNSQFGCPGPLVTT